MPTDEHHRRIMDTLLQASRRGQQSQTDLADDLRKLIQALAHPNKTAEAAKAELIHMLTKPL